MGASGLVTGWGKTADGGHWSEVLRKVKIPIVPDQQCVNNVRETFIIEDKSYLFVKIFHHSVGLHNIFTLSPNQFCAGDIVKRKGPCEVTQSYITYDIMSDMGCLHLKLLLDY